MAKSVSDLLSAREGSRLELKRDLSSMTRVLEAVCSFLNTSGGTVVVGVEDGTRTPVGLPDIEQAEERLANAVNNSIEPQPTVQIEVATYEGKDLLLLRCAYSAGPFYLKRKGKENGTFVRVGSNAMPARPNTV